LDSAATVEALQFYADLYNKYKVAPPPADINAFAGGNTEFEGAQAAMRILGRWPQADLKARGNIDLGVVGLPVGKRRANVLFWSGFGIYSGSLYKEGRGDFCAFTQASKAQRCGKIGPCPP